MGFKSNKYMTGMKSKKAFKTFSVAALVGLASVGVAQGATIDEVDLSQQPLNTPTLDYLGENGVIYQKDADADGVLDTPVDIDGDGVANDPLKSGYNLIETTDTRLDNVITKYIYDETNNTITKKHYQVELKQTEYGDDNGDGVKYYKLETLENGIKKLVDSTPDQAQFITKYDISNPQIKFENSVDISQETIVGNYIALNNKSGGAIRNRGIRGEITGYYIETCEYKGSYGRAIYNSDATIDKVKGIFVGNYATRANIYHPTYAYGGAIYNKNSTINYITADFIGNYVDPANPNGTSIIKAHGGAIYNEKGVLGEITGDFIGNYVESNSSDGDIRGGAIYNNGSINNVTGDFINNYAYDRYAGSWRSSDAYGGAIYNNSTIGNITGDFIGNYIESSYISNGGAIYNTGDIINISGDFIENAVISDDIANGAALLNGSGGTIENVIGNFIGNYALSDGGRVAGGAIYNFGDIKNIIGNFANNYLSSDYFNSIYCGGGAIGNRGFIDNISGYFTNNYTTSLSDTPYGGAIYNEDKINNISGLFVENFVKAVKGSAKGGAIYNHSYDDGAVTINDISADFIGNYAISPLQNSYGGAIANDSSYYCLSSSIDNIVGNFIQNYVYSEKNAYGGAIYNNAPSNNKQIVKISNITGDFIQNYAVSKTANAYGGAIYNTGFITIKNSSFIDNNAKSESGFAYGGAIYNSGDLNIVSKDGYISVFDGNYTESVGVKEDNAIFLGSENAILNFNLLTGGKILLADSILSESKSFCEFYKDNGVLNFDGYARSQGYKDTSVETFLSRSDYSTVDEYIRTQGYKDTPIETFLSRTDYSTVDEYVRSQGYMDTPRETALAGSGFSTVDEALRAEGFGDTPTETYLNMSGYSSLDEMVKDAGFESVDAFLATTGYTTFEDALKVEMNLYGNTPEEQFVHMKGYETFEDFLKEEQGLYGDTPEEQFLHKVGYETFEDYLKAKEKLAGNTPEEQFLYKTGYETFEDYLKAKEKLFGNTPEDQLLYELGYKSVEDYLKANGYKGLPIVNIQGDDINNTTFYLLNDIHSSDVRIGNTTINTINNVVHNYNFSKLTLTADTNMVVDVDLANQRMDRFTASEYGSHSGNLNVTGMNLLSDAVSDKTEILFAEQGLKDNVTNGITSQLPDDKYQTTLFTPIYKYNVSYDNREDAGYFVFTRPTTGGSTGGAPSVDTFNPAVLGSSTSATVGATATMNQAFNYAFQNSADYMNIPYLERISMRDRNKYALSITGDATDMGRFSPLYRPSDEEASVWVKPYATFETVGLKNGPKVHNNTYGTLIGFDTEMQSIKRGWDRVFTGYIGYNGASQRYSGIDSTQNGGLLGGTMTLYKGNFFNATTVSVGASVANNQTMYGNEDFVMLLSGIGNKTGYNFEFKEGKLILQPSMLMSYTFVNTFDYTNAAGVRIDNKPLHALQLAPGVKVIGNLKGGWQPYLSVSMIWNLIGESHATANGVKLPEMSIKPYVQYGVGVQKRIKDHFTAYGQAMVQNGGRNGVSLTAGFRWALGHDNCKYKVEDKQLRGKAAKQLRGNAAKQLRGKAAKQLRGNADKQLSGNAAKSKYHYEERSDVVISSNNAIATPSARNDNGRKILKQMTPEQKMAHGGKYYNTTRTAKSGSLRQY